MLFEIVLTVLFLMMFILGIMFLGAIFSLIAELAMAWAKK